MVVGVLGGEKQQPRERNATRTGLPAAPAAAEASSTATAAAPGEAAGTCSAAETTTPTPAAAREAAASAATKTTSTTTAASTPRPAPATPHATTASTTTAATTGGLLDLRHGSGGRLGLGQEPLEREQLLGRDVEAVAGLEGGGLDALGRLDREVDLVERAEDLVDLPHRGLVLQVYRCAEVGELGVDALAHHLALARVQELAHLDDGGGGAEVALLVAAAAAWESVC